VDAEGVEIGDPEAADAQSGQRQQVYAADPAQAGDGDRAPAQPGLLGFGEPSEVAAESFFVTELCCYRLARCPGYLRRMRRQLGMVRGKLLCWQYLST